MESVNQLEKSPPAFVDRLPHKKIFGFRLIAFVEAVLGLALIVLFDYLFGKGNRFIDVHPHPFWVVILLVTVQYGTMDGVMSVILATLFLYFGNLPDQGLEESIFQYQLQLALRPMLWLIMAFILGELRMRQENEKEDIRLHYEQARQQAKQIAQSYESLKKVKESLEVRLTSQLKTSALTYNTFKALSTLSPGAVLLNLDQVIIPALNPKKFSVYSTGPNGFEPVISYGWGEKEPYTRRFLPGNPLYQELVEKQRIVCIVNQEDEKLLGGQGVLAAPLIDVHSGEIFGMLKIEEMEFLELNISSLEIFRTICELIGKAYANAKSHKRAEENAIYSPFPRVFSYHFYGIQKDYLEKLAQQGNFPLSLVQLHVKEHEEHELEMVQLYSLLIAHMPPIAQIFGNRKGEHKVFILFPLYRQEEIEAILHKIFEALKMHPAMSRHQPSYTIEHLNKLDK